MNRKVNNNLTFDPFQGINNLATNSGKIELVFNDSLKLKITRFQDLLNDYKEEETNVMLFTERNLYPFQLDNAKINFSIAHGTEESSKNERMEYKQDMIQLI